MEPAPPLPALIQFALNVRLMKAASEGIYPQGQRKKVGKGNSETTLKLPVDNGRGFNIEIDRLFQL